MPQPASLNFTIYQGATFSERWQRLLCAYAVVERNGKLVRKEDGRPVPLTDLVPDDYTGCTARMQLRESVDSLWVLDEFDTADGSITLTSDGWVQIDKSDEDTTAMKYGSNAKSGAWQSAIGQLEVTRQDGSVERQFVIAFALDPEGTK